MRTIAVCLFASFVFAGSAYAGKPIAKCINAEGELIFTDYLCETAEPGHNPLLMNETAINPSVRSRIPSVVKADTIVSSQLKSATAEAQAQCEQQFGNYFKRKHPSVESIPRVEFTNIIDQFIKGSDVSVSLSGTVEYNDDSYAVNSSIECTVQRFKSASEWFVGYRER